MQAHMKPLIKDFDKMIKKEKYAILSGVTIDVSTIPSRVAVLLSSYQAKMKSGEIAPEDMFYEMVDLAARVCAVKNPEITADWILDNTDVATLSQFIKYVLAVTEEAIDTEKKSETEPGA